MTKQSQTSQSDLTTRRGFLKAAIATSAVAVVGGTGAALVAREVMDGDDDALIAISAATQPTISSSTVSSSVTTPAAAPAVTNNSDVYVQVAELQAENLRLQTALENANARIAQLEGNVTTGVDQSSQLRTELAASNGQLGVMAGLMALYQQLDNADVGDRISDGLQNMGEAVVDLVDDVPTFSEAIGSSREALAAFETDINLVGAGRSWLLNHLGRIQRFYDAVESMLASTVDRVGPFLDMLVDWFESVIKWLPFGLGENTRNIMVAMIDLFGETPATISGTQVNLLDPLAQWLGDDDDDDVPLVRNMVEPMREGVLSSAETSITKATQLNTTYQATLAVPAKTAIDNRNAIRASIQSYREQHEL